MIERFVKAKERFIGVIKDIRNYFFIWKTIKQNRDTPKWLLYKLRYDYILRIYTVINLRPEDFGEADQMIRELRYREKAEPMYEYLTELNLSEVITPVVEYLPGTYSYLVKFIPKFEHLQFGWLMGFIIKYGIIGYILYGMSHVLNIDHFWKLLIDFLTVNKILR